MRKKEILMCSLIAVLCFGGCTNKPASSGNVEDNKQENNNQENNKQEDSKQENSNQEDNNQGDNKQENNKQGDSKQEDSNQEDNTKENNSADNNILNKGEGNMDSENNKVTRPNSYKEYAEWAQEKLVENYWNTFTKSVANSYPYDEEKENALNYWWKAHAADAMIDGYERTKDEVYSERAVSIIKNIISQNGSLYNEFYDDMEWLTLACLRLYDLTGNEKMKEYSVKLWNDIKTAWWEDSVGGLAWKKDEARKNRNACSNGPGAIIAARMYERFKDEEDLEWAKKIYAFEKKYLVDEKTGMVYDGMVVEPDGTLNINKDWLFTYNAGTFIGAAVELYRNTGDEVYLADAEKTAASAMEAFTTVYGVVKSEGNGDGGMFKGILIRYLQKLYEVNNDSAIADFIKKNADKLAESGSTPDKGLFGPEWNKVPKTPLDVTCELSGVFLFEAAAKVSGE